MICTTFDEYLGHVKAQMVRHGIIWPKTRDAECLVGFGTPSGEWWVHVNTVEAACPSESPSRDELTEWYMIHVTAAVKSGATQHDSTEVS